MSLSRTIAQSIVKNNLPLESVVERLKTYKLLPLLTPIMHHLRVLEKQSSREDTLEIESPFPVSDESLAVILKKSGSKKESKYHITITPSILAGWKARYRGKLYDGSAERIIRQLVG